MTSITRYPIPVPDGVNIDGPSRQPLAIAENYGRLQEIRRYMKHMRML